jgi:hypothetical protein
MKPPLNSIYPTILQSDSAGPPVVPSAKAGDTGEGVLDEQTFRVIEVDQLFGAVNHATTCIGEAVLYRSLTQPLMSSDSIRAKQEAVREIEDSPALRSGLVDLLHAAKKLENDFYGLLFGNFLGLIGSPAHKLEIEGYGYETYKRGTRFMLDLVDRAKQLPTPKNEYLRALLEDIGGLATSRAYALMRGPVYRTEKAVLTRAERGFFMPAIKFRPSLFKPVGLTLMVVALLLILEFGVLALPAASWPGLYPDRRRLRP